MLNTPERITTDILVIGGGSSGLWTAKGAKEADPNADVLIVDKSFRDWGGLMHLSGGDLEVCRGGDSAEDWVKDFTYYWDGLCQQDVMETIWQQSHEIFEEYQRRSPALSRPCASLPRSGEGNGRPQCPCRHDP